MLAARKRLGTEAAVTGEIPDEAALAGQRFFNLNFGDGAYGTVDRTFEMTLEDDYSITGKATVSVPTTLMYIFGHDDMAVAVECQAQLDMANTDMMMVLDVTGSMAQINPGDTVPRIQALKTTVGDFYDQLTAAANAGTRLRFGFVPYSSNVNVGHLLQDDWVNTSWALPVARAAQRDRPEGRADRPMALRRVDGPRRAQLAHRDPRLHRGARDLRDRRLRQRRSDPRARSRHRHGADGRVRRPSGRRCIPKSSTRGR